jgi:Uma2 family endonuclease
MTGMNQPSQGHHRYTFADYLAYEDGANVKHEFLDGEIYALAGGTPEHAALAAAVTTIIGAQLGEGPCRVFSSDLKVRVVATGLVSYPDITVICGPIEHDPESRMVVVNPTLVVEVLSDSTQDWDRGEKLEHYKRIPSLRECLLVSHQAPALELWRRQRDGSWSHHAAGGGGSLQLESIGALLATDEIYRRALGTERPARV